MPRAHSTALALLALAAIVGAAPRAAAQAPADLSQRSVRGLATVSVQASADWQDNLPFQWSGGAGYAPFVTEHWQVGAALGAAGIGRDGSFDGSTIGAATALANYWIGASRRSRPHVGVFATVAEGTAANDITSWGGSVGWSHFVTPFAALDASLTGARYSYDPGTHTALRVSLQPYAFGRAGGAEFAGMRPQTRGALDLVVDANAAFSPTRAAALRIGAAPFLFRALQVGGALNASHSRGTDLAGRRRGYTDHELEGFARVYYPTGGTLHPFVGAFASTGTRSFTATRDGSRGVSAGVRAYPNPGLALDLALELRRFTSPHLANGVSQRPDRLGMRVGLTPHLPRRAAR